MTAALLDRPDTATNDDCRFSAWCKGECAARPGDVNRERSHWSHARVVTELEFGDRLGVELFHGECPGETTETWVCLTAGDEFFEEDTYSLTPAQARDLGAALQVPRTGDDDDRLLWRSEPDDQQALTAEFRQARIRRNGTHRAAQVEVSLHTSSQKHSLRIRLDLSGAWFLGRYLMFAADEASEVQA